MESNEGAKNRVTRIFVVILSIMGSVLVLYLANRYFVNPQDEGIPKSKPTVKKSKDKDERVKYNLIGSNELKQYFLKSKEILIDSESKNTIEITHNGIYNPIPPENKTFNYIGGNIIIRVNDDLCRDLIQYKIKSYGINSKEILERTVKRDIREIISSNIEVFKAQIIDCL